MITPRRVEKMIRVIKNRQPDLTLICENIHDPHNVSAIFRTCDAVGIEKVHLLYHDQPFPKIGKRSSASAKKWIDIERHNNPDKLRRVLKQQDYFIYATNLNSQSLSIYEVDWTSPSAIIMGNEHLGVSDETLKIADASIYIPMFGMLQSLNVSVAAAVILYEVCRRRLQQKFYPHPKKTPEEVSSILEKWKEK